MSLYAITDVAPCLFESRVLSEPRIIGTWPNLGIWYPKASYICICLGVLFRWSSPLITWVIFMVASSITTQKLYVGHPSERRITRSSSSALSTTTLPLTMSSTTVYPSSGERKRTAAGTSGLFVFPLHFPSYLGFFPSLNAFCLFASSSSGEHVQ